MAAVYVDDILQKPAAPTKGTLSEMAKGTITGSIIGLVGGTLYAYFKKKPYGQSMIIGTIIGSAVSAVFLIKK